MGVVLVRKTGCRWTTAIIFTDIDAVDSAINIPLIPSGGVQTLGDLLVLHDIPGTDGAIVGRAFFERLDWH